MADGLMELVENSSHLSLDWIWVRLDSVRWEPGEGAADGGEGGEDGGGEEGPADPAFFGVVGVFVEFFLSAFRWDLLRPWGGLR